MKTALIIAGLSVLAFAGCPEDPPATSGPKPVVVSHGWSFTGETAGMFDAIIKDTQSSANFPVDDSVELGTIPLAPPGEPLVATAEVHATENGVTYWTSAVAPQGDLSNEDSLTTVQAHLDQTSYYRKTDDLATLKLVVTEDLLEIIDSNPNRITQQECPWMNLDPKWPDSGCSTAMLALNLMTVEAWVDRDVPDQSSPTGKKSIHLVLGEWQTTTNLRGLIGSWIFNSYTYDKDQSSVAFLDSARFDVNRDVDDFLGVHARARLAASDSLSIPLDAVHKDEIVKLRVDIDSHAGRRRVLESYVGARFRDPQHASGLGVEIAGLVPTSGPTTDEAPPAPPPTPAPDCATGTDDAAGQIQFGESSTLENEFSPGFAQVAVTRTGGTKGVVSAAVTVGDGTAHAGVDFQPLVTQVRFADGEEGSHFVKVALIDNQLIDGTRTAELVLSDPRGCAVLGSQATSTLVILDDEQPVPDAPTHSIGGTVTGLSGSGLVLREMFSGATVAPSGDGPFTVATDEFEGRHYDVRVETQPTNPFQACSVADGTGVVGTADVTDVMVTCTTSAANGALDPAYGSGGRAVSGVMGAPAAMALQPDGKALLVGDLTLARFNVDGSLDTGFGTAGVAAVPFTGSSFGKAQGLAIQPDGRIVVVGYTAVGNQDDFALARFEADGTLDGTFGSGGKVTTDFAGSTDQARRVAIQPDGRLVVVGVAIAGTDVDFAVARYLADGTLDTSFGSGGKVHTSIVARFNTAAGVALQADGKIVVAGRVAVDGGTDPDVGVVRYQADGSLDMTFGTAGIVSADFGLGAWEEAADVAVQPDGKVVLVGRGQAAGAFVFLVARLTADGIPDSAFGSGGFATTAFGTQLDSAAALALQSDGKIVVAGQAENLGPNPDFAATRYLADGTPDSTFGTDGKVTVDFFGGRDGATGVALQSDGKIVVGGAAGNAGTTVFALARLVP